MCRVMWRGTACQAWSGQAGLRTAALHGKTAETDDRGSRSRIDRTADVERVSSWPKGLMRRRGSVRHRPLLCGTKCLCVGKGLVCRSQPL